MTRGQSIAVFPGLWIASLCILCFTHAFALLACVLATLIGWSAFAAAIIYRASPKGSDPVAHRPTNALLSELLIVSGRLLTFAGIVVGSWIGVGEYHYFFNDPIGLEGDLGWGAGPCLRKEVAAISNGKGHVARLRFLLCSDFGPIDSVQYFVFIVKPGESNDRSNLAFGYYSEARDSLERTRRAPN